MKKILLVEDDQFIRDIYVQMLSPIYEVDQAEDGQIAYDKVIKNSYDLILLDMFLPKMDGKIVFEKLQKEFPDKFKNKIVFLTNDDSEVAIKFFDDTDLEYIIKSSVNPEEFVNKVKTYLP